jgi:hypothetical protein
LQPLPVHGRQEEIPNLPEEKSCIMPTGAGATCFFAEVLESFQELLPVLTHKLPGAARDA